MMTDKMAAREKRAWSRILQYGNTLPEVPLWFLGMRPAKINTDFALKERYGIFIRLIVDNKW